MNIRDRHGLKAAAREALAAAPENRKLVLISAGVAAALSLCVSLLTFLLDGQIAQTAGLGGLGLRSVLSTLQSLLSMATSLLLPFWTFGYVSAVLKLSRGQSATPDSLLDGFRRFRPILRLLLLEGLLYAALIVLCIYAGSAILSFTPLASPLYEMMLPFMSGDTTPDAATQEAILNAMTPLIIGCVVLACAASIPLSYRLRMARFLILEGSTCKARTALQDSNRMMRGNCFALFRLDLSFWWYYLAQTAVMLLSYGDVITEALGVDLPLSDSTALFLFYVLGLLGQLILSYYCQNFVEVTDAKAYEALRQPPVPREVPENIPWKY